VNDNLISSSVPEVTKIMDPKSRGQEIILWSGSTSLLLLPSTQCSTLDDGAFHVAASQAWITLLRSIRLFSTWQTLRY